MRPKLFQVVPTKDYNVYLYYDNGEIKLYDCKWALTKSGIFTKLHSADAFVELCCIMNNTLAFDVAGDFDNCNCIDICPDTIYTDSVPCNHDILIA